MNLNLLEDMYSNNESPTGDSPKNQSKPKLLDKLRNKIRRKGYSYSTEKSYVQWTKQYIYFHNRTHPAELDATHVLKFLDHLVNRRNVSPSTQNQALSAILFLYRQVLEQSDFYVDNIDWSKKPQRFCR